MGWGIIRPPTIRVRPSFDREIEPPTLAPEVASETIDVCWFVQVTPLRVHTEITPLLPFHGTPTASVFPAPERETEVPNALLEALPGIRCCCVQVEPFRVQIHTQPPTPSLGAPIAAVFPSLDRATDAPLLT